MVEARPGPNLSRYMHLPSLHMSFLFFSSVELVPENPRDLRENIGRLLSNHARRRSLEPL